MNAINAASGLELQSKLHAEMAQNEIEFSSSQQNIAYNRRRISEDSEKQDSLGSWGHSVFSKMQLEHLYQTEGVAVHQWCIS